MAKARAQKIIKRSDLQELTIEAMHTPQISMGTNIANEWPGIDPLAYVWGECITYGSFAKYGMGASNGGLSYASVVRVNPKTLGDFESKCIEPWFKQKGWTIQ